MTWHLIAHWLGLDSAGGPAYLAWSGFGSDISELAIVGAVLGMLKRHNCHQPRCWRLGRHMVNGTPWCDRHHGAARGESEGS